MRYHGLAGAERPVEALKQEYASGRAVGTLRLGGGVLFFRGGLKTYYIPYEEITRCFRRVMMVPAKLCCGKGTLPVESLVICGGAGELAQIQLPGANAARIVMEELKQRLPHAEFGSPPERENTNG